MTKKSKGREPDVKHLRTMCLLLIPLPVVTLIYTDSVVLYLLSAVFSFFCCHLFMMVVGRPEDENEEFMVKTLYKSDSLSFEDSQKYASNVIRKSSARKVLRKQLEESRSCRSLPDV